MLSKYIGGASPAAPPPPAPRDPRLPPVVPQTGISLEWGAWPRFPVPAAPPATVATNVAAGQEASPVGSPTSVVPPSPSEKRFHRTKSFELVPTILSPQREAALRMQLRPPAAVGPED